MIKSITTLIEHPEDDFIYNVLSYFTLNLCLDIGAASGQMTRRIRVSGSTNTKVVAFEPFPGNYKYFSETTQDLNNIKLVKMAVSDTVGTAKFVVPSMVIGTEPGWEKYIGYSSVGFLSYSTYKSIKQRLKHEIRKALSIALHGSKKLESKKIRVKTTTIDSMFSEEEIDFIKIDVQGAEYRVLLGASNMLGRNKIGILYIEWTGERDVIELLTEYNYDIYDSIYVGFARCGDHRLFEKNGFKIIRKIDLSIGRTAYEMIYQGDINDLFNALYKIKSRGLGWIQTDLIALSQDKKDKFIEAVKLYSDKQINKSPQSI